MKMLTSKFILLSAILFTMFSCSNKETPEPLTNNLSFLNALFGLSDSDDLILLQAKMVGGAPAFYSVEGIFNNEEQVPVENLGFYLHGFNVPYSPDFKRPELYFNEISAGAQELNNQDGNFISLTRNHSSIGFNASVLNLKNIDIDYSSLNNFEISKSNTSTVNWVSQGLSSDSVRMFINLDYWNRDTIDKYEQYPNYPSTLFEIPDNGSFQFTPQLMAGFAPNNEISVSFLRVNFSQFKRIDGKKVGFLKVSEFRRRLKLKQ